MPEPEYANNQSESQQDEIETEYANNTSIDATVWDIKIIFGEYSGRSSSVDWHTSVTLPWAAAKLLVLYLQSNIAVYEILNGKIKVDPSMVPKEPPTPSEASPKSQEIHSVISELRDKFLESNR